MSRFLEYSVGVVLLILLTFTNVGNAQTVLRQDGSLPRDRSFDSNSGRISSLPSNFRRQDEGITERLEDISSRDAETENEAENESEKFETDRDSFTPSPRIAELNRVILESSYTFIDNRYAKETHSYPELLLRYGATERIELRLGWNFEVGGGNSVLSGNVAEAHGHHAELEKEANMLYGFKALLTEQQGLTPTSSFILQGYTPTQGESSLTRLSATAVAGWELPSEINFDIATRFQTSEFETDRFEIWSPSAVVKFPLFRNAEAHLEYFGAFSENRENATVQHFFSPGVHHMVHRDLEVGWRAGWGLNDQSPNFFFNFGIGRRF